MMVMIHDNAQLPDIEMAGMQLAPGQHHKMSYTKKTNFVLSAPYSTCNDKNNLGMQLMFDQYHDTNYGYSEFSCFSVCIQAYT
jgi:hypothetical protein